MACPPFMPTLLACTGSRAVDGQDLPGSSGRVQAPDVRCSALLCCAQLQLTCMTALRHIIGTAPGS